MMTALLISSVNALLLSFVPVIICFGCVEFVILW